MIKAEDFPKIVAKVDILYQISGRDSSIKIANTNHANKSSYNSFIEKEEKIIRFQISAKVMLLRLKERVRKPVREFHLIERLRIFFENHLKRAPNFIYEFF